MSFLEYLLVLTGVICCTAVPVSDPNAPTDSCGVPTRYPDKELQGTWNEKFYNPGKRALYSCRPGFSRLGSIQYLCSEGQWVPMGTLGQCKKKSCGHPGDIEFGTFELKNEEEFVFGAVVEYTCNDGYQMISRHKTRECTATGWTNFRPECEVRFCPPVQVNSNVNLLTTSYDEEYSVGQVIRFECKNAHQKLKGATEIFCGSEGDWNAQPPICEEISCGKPEIAHGRVTGFSPHYKDKDTTEYSCDPGYRPSTRTGLTCTKNDWSPMPLCEEIVCYQEVVKYGNVRYTKETYRDGETVELTCNEGYQIEHNPEEHRKCTSHGWSPPLKCISKKCDKPIVLNGYIDTWASFPVSPGRSFYSVCNSGFSTSTKERYETITCTKNGWDHEPKCFKQCYSPSQDSIKAVITYTSQSTYIEGDKLQFQCYRDYTTLDGKQTGQITCLPDGKFSGEKCHKTCQTPKLVHGEYKTSESTFKVGGYVLYECNEGFFSINKAYEGRSQCGSDGWHPNPECKEITCSIPRDHREELSFKFGKVIYYQCQNNWKLEGANSSQCFYYGWGPIFPICKGPEVQESSPLVIIKSKPSESNCPTASAPPNAQIRNLKGEYFSEDVMEIECNPGYLLYGSERVLCKNGKWQSPPLCTEKVPCRSAPPVIRNGEISKETLADRYSTGSTVKYICEDGYHIIGSEENKCIDGNWLPPPTCIEKSCGNPQEIENGKPRDGRKEYNHAESAAYECSQGYKLSGSEAAVCLYGKWARIPKCIYSSCGPPPKISNGEIRGQKTTYLTGEKVIYDCVRGFTVGNNPNFITCENAAWTEPPECRRIGQSCGAPPVVQNGDITDLKKLSYPSGSIVKYKCANFYKLEGKETITCRDGEWEKEPICRVPCTVRDIDMQQNNIRFKHINERKLYSEHFDNMSFVCIQEYKISDEKRLRIQCLDGVLKFPKCLKEGFCVLQQTEMSRNNIRYNKSNEIEPGQTIEFECVEGMVPENGLKGTCMNKRIMYPKCSTGRPCLPPKISNALISPKKEDSYESGSSIDIKCEDTYVLNGHISVECDNGKWDELPQCFKPCTISTRSLDKNHIEMKPSENPPEKLEHGTEVNVKCKANFRRPGALTALCSDGIMKYPKCFSGEICRINQQSLDDNFLELDEKHDNEVFYGEGETVSFKCKAGYSNRTGLTGTCTKPEKEANYGLTYPVCT